MGYTLHDRSATFCISVLQKTCQLFLFYRRVLQTEASAYVPGSPDGEGRRQTEKQEEVILRLELHCPAQGTACISLSPAMLFREGALKGEGLSLLPPLPRGHTPIFPSPSKGPALLLITYQRLCRTNLTITYHVKFCLPCDVKDCLLNNVKNSLPTNVKISLPYHVKNCLPSHVKKSLTFAALRISAFRIAGDSNMRTWKGRGESRRRLPVAGVSSAAFSTETSDLPGGESRRLRLRREAE